MIFEFYKIIQINFKKDFVKSYKNLDLKIKIKTDKAIIVFKNNPFDISLNNHKLSGDYQWFGSINVTWDYRIIFYELSNGTYELVELVDIWTHSQLYK